MSSKMAMLPYIILAISAIFVLAIPPVEEALSQVSVGFPLPEVETCFGVNNESGQTYSPFAVFTHPGFFLLLSSIITWGVYRYKGFYGAKAQQEKEQEGNSDEPEGIWSGVVKNALPASIAIIAFLALAKIMDYSGQTPVLAASVVATAPPIVFSFSSNWIGVLGAFMTSSNTASNILFAPLQSDAAQGLEGLSQSTIVAGQNAGGAVGNAISPANAILGTGTAGIIGKEGKVLRKTLL